jgi:hypothetical protein
MGTMGCTPGFDECGLEVIHVRVLVEVPLRLGKPDAVDDGCVVQGIGDYRRVRPEQRLKHPAIGIETCGIEKRVISHEVKG